MDDGLAVVVVEVKMRLGVEGTSVSISIGCSLGAIGRGVKGEAKERFAKADVGDVVGFGGEGAIKKREKAKR